MPTSPSVPLHSTAPTGAPGTSAPATSAPTLAGTGIRIGAFAITLLIATLCTVVIAVGFTLLSWFSAGSPVGSRGATTFSVAGTLAVFGVPLGALVVYAISMAARGTSIGHRLAGLRVVDLDTHRRARPGRALLRTVVLFAPLLAALVLGASHTLVTLLGSDSGAGVALGAASSVAAMVVPVWWTVLLVQVITGRRALHDRAADTMVLAWHIRPRRR